MPGNIIRTPTTTPIPIMKRQENTPSNSPTRVTMTSPGSLLTHSTQEWTSNSSEAI